MKKNNKQTETKDIAAVLPKPTLGERLNNYIVPMLLGGVLCFAVMYILYRPSAPMYTALFLVEELGLFMLFDRLKTRKVFGTIVYLMMMTAAVFIALSLLFNGAVASGFMSPVTWFYGEEGSYSYQPLYLNAVFIGGGFFLLSILYYFTQIRYRSLGVMLCILFPFVIYAKRADPMPEVLVTLIISLYLAVMVHNRRLNPAIEKSKRGILVVNTAYIISMGIFVSVTGAVTMMIDKPTYFSQLEKDSSYFDHYQTQGTGQGNFEDMSNQSSSRSGGLDYANTPLFYMETNGGSDLYFLRRQSYDKFNGENWEITPDGSDYSAAYSTIIPEYATDDILADMTEVAEQTGDIPAPVISNAIPTRQARVYDEKFAPVYLPAPYGTITDYTDFEHLEFRKYPQSVIVRTKAWNVNPTPPLNDSFEFNEQTRALYGYAVSLGMNGVEYVHMLDKLAEADENHYSAARRLRDDYVDAYKKYMDISKVSDKLVEFSYEVTKDCKSDIEKAQALEHYFTKAGFEYSLEYVPEDMSIEYFVFNSKTGYCTSFATAMTLMARSVGLPARYVEGFAAFEQTADGDIVIRDGHAHAFVEVYIPGTGWLTFDPTVSDYRTIIDTDAGGFDLGIFLRILSRFIVVIIVAFFIIFVLLLDRIVELVFRIRLRFNTPDKRTLMLYSNVHRLVNYSTKEDYSAYTVKMLRGYLSESRCTVPEKLFDLFERTAFGGYQPTAEEFDEAYQEYKHCYKYLRRLPRPKELAKLKGVPYVK